MSVAAAISELSDAASAEARAQFAELLGHALTPSEHIRLRRQPDGKTFVAAVYAPTVARRELGAHVDQPWRNPDGLRKVAAFVSLREAAARILDPSSDDNEVARRETLFEAEQVRRAEQEKLMREQTVREEVAAREQRQREQRAAEQFDADGFARLPLEAKLLHMLALAADDGLQGAGMAKELRRLALLVEKSGTVPFPGRRWRA